MAEYTPPSGPNAGPQSVPPGPPPGGSGGEYWGPPMQPQPVSGIPADVASKRILCGVLAIVLGVMQLGFIGVHKFILGYTRAGLIMLLVTVCTCGIAGIVMNVISIIEGVIYLTRSDEDFYRNYIVAKKEWF
jgi:TM2 domain-containing membrane protein YozV